MVEGRCFCIYKLRKNYSTIENANEKLVMHEQSPRYDEGKNCYENIKKFTKKNCDRVTFILV